MDYYMEFDFNHTNVSAPMDLDELYASLTFLDPDMQIFVIILYSCTAVASLGGNGASIAVLVSKHRSIRLFLINLALSDVTMAVFSIPFTYTDFVLGRWIFLPEFCPIVQFMQHVSVSVSVYTLTVVSIDRYYAIIYPLSGRWTKARGRIIIFAIWVFSISVSSLQLVHGKATRYEVGGQEIYDCGETWDEFEGKIYTVAIFFVTFLVPTFVLSFTYGSIGCRMWTRQVPGNADVFRDRLQLAAKLKTDLKKLISFNERRVPFDPRTSTVMTRSCDSNKSANIVLRPLRPAEQSLLRRPI